MSRVDDHVARRGAGRLLLVLLAAAGLLAMHGLSAHHTVPALTPAVHGPSHHAEVRTTPAPVSAEPAAVTVRSSPTTPPTHDHGMSGLCVAVLVGSLLVVVLLLTATRAAGARPATAARARTPSRGRGPPLHHLAPSLPSLCVSRT